MKIGHGMARTRFKIGHASDDDRLGAGRTAPHRNRGAPEPVSGNRPVAGVLEPLTEATVADMLRHPVDLLVVGQQALFQRGDAHEPRAHGPVHQGLVAAPAMRVVMQVVRAVEHQAAFGQMADDPARCLEHDAPSKSGTSAVNVRRR